MKKGVFFLVFLFCVTINICGVDDVSRVEPEDDFEGLYIDKTIDYMSSSVDFTFELGLDYVLWDKFYLGLYSDYLDIKFLLDNISIHSYKLKTKLYIKSDYFFTFGFGRFLELGQHRSRFLLGVDHRFSPSVLVGVDLGLGEEGIDPLFQFYITGRTSFSTVYSKMKMPLKGFNPSRKTVEFSPSIDESTGETIDFNQQFNSDDDFPIRSPG
ncbi:hypothetical protein DID78_01105 [Candidatus Marinamargulisbacteria bacterium SCGC AG-343-D04]|nr:hypothetical protein DID78_01105 [Candidatus Marinamargulisbacteria bacterium SCGC AG-343-D04]